MRDDTAERLGDHGLEIDVLRGSDSDTLALRGELDMATAGTLEAAIERLCSAGSAEIVLDMHGLDFIDSTGFRAIIASRAMCEEFGCELVMTRPQERVHRVLDVSGVLRRLPFR